MTNLPLAHASTRSLFEVQPFPESQGKLTVVLSIHITVAIVIQKWVESIVSHAFAERETKPSKVGPVDIPVSIRVANACATPARIVGSRSHRGASLDRFLENVGDHDMVPMGSSLKFCVVAEGAADVYPRLGPTSEWDTAAAQAVVEQAGGKVVTLDGKPMKYNAKADILNPHFIVVGAADRDWLALLPDCE